MSEDKYEIENEIFAPFLLESLEAICNFENVT
jgi:hypothetical protein